MTTLIAIPASIECPPLTVESRWLLVTEREFKKTHRVHPGAPCDWSLARGATHTLIVNDPLATNGQGTRPAILANKSTLYVGVDELDGGRIKWEKWSIKTLTDLEMDVIRAI